MTLKVIEGNLLDIEEGIIAHQCNCQGVMGSGIAKAIRDKWPVVFEQYQIRCKMAHGREEIDPRYKLLGDMQLVQVRRFTEVDDGLYVANIFGQNLYGKESRKTNYGAASKAIAELSGYKSVQIYFPYLIGCGLGGGDFEVYSEIIEFYIPNAIVVKLPELS